MKSKRKLQRKSIGIYLRVAIIKVPELSLADLQQWPTASGVASSSGNRLCSLCSLGQMDHLEEELY